MLLEDALTAVHEATGVGPVTLAGGHEVVVYRFAEVGWIATQVATGVGPVETVVQVVAL